ncbi:hypothetical protein Mame_01206 [Martelella mediterranea DSM 17316]|uniref:Uncharacterized protein n=1 Tax=Martelella mediterranea DSM 17316 TaxID=1122214 RepID=A0A1U9YYQ0_9HYPH|nr:hypothetical protein Mame_01206 [Martelella mediterranea DSM 17316]
MWVKRVCQLRGVLCREAHTLIRPSATFSPWGEGDAGDVLPCRVRLRRRPGYPSPRRGEGGADAPGEGRQRLPRAVRCSVVLRASLVDGRACACWGAHRRGPDGLRPTLIRPSATFSPWGEGDAGEVLPCRVRLRRRLGSPSPRRGEGGANAPGEGRQRLPPALHLRLYSSTHPRQNHRMVAERVSASACFGFRLQ